MPEFLSLLSEPWAIRAIITSSMVGILCGSLGCFIVLRNMSLIGDALSHAILPGIFISFLLLGYSTIGFFIGSTLAGLLAAFAITWIQQNVSTKNDAAIGIIFTAMFSIGVIGISSLSHNQGVHLDLKDFLFGTVLSISNEDIFLTFIVTVYTLISIVVFYRYLFISTFQSTIAQTMGIPVKMIHYFLMLLLSFAVVASIRSVGVILVVAMLITPAATALLISSRLKNVIVISAFIGLFSALTGFFVSLVFNTTPGPAMTVMATLYYFIAVIFAPEKGILFRKIRAAKEKGRILREDIVKRIFKSKQDGITIEHLAEELSVSIGKTKAQLQRLLSKEIISKSSSNLYQLTIDGKVVAERLVRAHRLWETYQVDKMGLQSDQIHKEAERIEHHLNENQLLEIEEKLGFPSNDPHGSPIPKSNVSTLANIKKGKRFRIIKDQKSNTIESFLWDKDLSYRDLLSFNSENEEGFQILQGRRRVFIPKDMGIQILISEELM